MQKDRYTLIEQSPKSRITCMQYSQKNFMRMIGNEQKNNVQGFWEILERIIGKISSIIGAGLRFTHLIEVPVFKVLTVKSVIAIYTFYELSQFLGSIVVGIYETGICWY